MAMNVIRRLGLLYLISLLLTSLFFSSCVSDDARRKARIKEATINKYNAKADELSKKISSLKSQIPALQQKIKVAVDPREQGKYVTEMQRIEGRLRKYKEKNDEIKRKMIELNNK